jgi:hypothetical protein
VRYLYLSPALGVRMHNCNNLETYPTCLERLVAEKAVSLLRFQRRNDITRRRAA